MMNPRKWLHKRFPTVLIFRPRKMVFFPDGPGSAEQLYKASDMHGALVEIREWLRASIKYQQKDYEEVQREFFDILIERGIDLDKMQDDGRQ